MKLFKKILFSIMLLTYVLLFLGALYYNVYNAFDISAETLLYISLLDLLIAIIIYPVNKKNLQLDDFMILPVIAAFIFGVVCLFIGGIVPEKVPVVNILVSMWGTYQYYKSIRGNNGKGLTRSRAMFYFE